MAQVISSRNNSAFSTFYTWLVLLLFFYTSFSSLPEGIMVFELGIVVLLCAAWSCKFSLQYILEIFQASIISNVFHNASFHFMQHILGQKSKKKVQQNIFLIGPPSGPPQNLFLLCIQHPDSFQSVFLMKNYNLLCFYLYVV